MFDGSREVAYDTQLFISTCFILCFWATIWIHVGGFFLILFLLASSKSSFGKLTSSLRPPITQRYPVGSNAHHNRYT